MIKHRDRPSRHRQQQQYKHNCWTKQNTFTGFKLTTGIKLAMVFNATFNNISVVCFIGGGNWSTRKKPPISRKSMTTEMNWLLQGPMKVYVLCKLEFVCPCILMMVYFCFVAGIFLMVREIEITFCRMWDITNLTPSSFVQFRKISETRGYYFRRL